MRSKMKNNFRLFNLFLSSILFLVERNNRILFKTLFAIALISVNLGIINAQTPRLDSLKRLFESSNKANLSPQDLYKTKKEYIYLSTNDVAQRVDSLTKISLEILQRNPEASMLLSNEAEKIAEASQDDVLRAMAYVSKSAVYSVNDNVEMILQYALKALDISEKTKLSDDIMASIYRKFGRVYRDQNNIRGSIEAYKKALAYSTKSNNTKDICGTAGTMGQIFGRLEKYDSALIYLKLALDLSKKIGYDDNIVRGYIHIMNLYDDTDKIPEAFSTVKEMEFWLNTKDISPVIKCLAYTAIADLDLRHGKTNRQLAARYLDSMRKVMNTTKPGTENLVNYYLGRSLLSFSRQEYDLGSEALTQYHAFKAIMDNQIIEGHSQDLATKYETGKKDALIKNLNVEKALQKKEQELSDTQKKGAFILAILLGVLSLLSYNRFRLKKKASEVLTLKNIEIEKQKEVIQNSLSEKETLLREIHHRVKNNLQIISSLLNIQSENISDPSVLSSIREGQSRVQAMSLIHQNLYQSEHLSNVDIENYLKQLVVYLSEMFATEDKDVKVEVDANNINFDIDTAIPLGLIVNELVSNAYKYAFEQQKSGTIKIGIKALNDEDYELHVDDDGKGLPADFNPNKGKSLGLKLVNILSRQLRGKFSTMPSEGASFIVKFKDLRAFNAQ
jgi:two-component sensor histidine kinase